MWRNVVTNPVISGPIILLIIAGQVPIPNFQLPRSPFAGGRRIAGNARPRPPPVRGPVPADDAYRQAGRDGGARDDAGALPALPPHPHLRTPRLARSPGVHPRARPPA